MKRFVLASLLAATAVPASAATYDVADFGSPFSYAQFNGGTSFTAFTNPCSFGSACLAGPDGAGNSQVAYDAGNFLVAHPSATGTDTAVIYTAPSTSLYMISGEAFLADTRAEAAAGNGVSLANYLDGNLFLLGSLIGPGSSDSFSNIQLNLHAGDQLALIIGDRGDNSYDSVELRGTISSAVPEPVTWAMMIGGFGLIGVMMRRSHRKSEEDITRQVRALATA